LRSDLLGLLLLQPYTAAHCNNAKLLLIGHGASLPVIIKSQWGAVLVITWHTVSFFVHH